MLASIIKVNSAEIAFKPQPLPASLANMTKNESDPDVILPLLFEVDLKISVQNSERTVTLRAPGTISADFDRLDSNKTGMGLKRIDIQLNTRTLLEFMVKEARMAVFNAVSTATSVTSNSLPTGNDLLKGSEQHNSHRAKMSSRLSPGFSSALKQSTSSTKFPNGGLPPPSPTKEGKYQHHSGPNCAFKSKSSSLRIGNVLSTSTSTLPKTRSVQFNTSDLKPKTGVTVAPKRLRVATTNTLTSYKSFGRPHAGDFGSEGAPKNATFGDFGGSQNFWGRDGKLASKPRPMLPSETTDMMTSQTRKNANATFDVPKPSIHLSRGTEFGMRLSGKNKPPSNAAFDQPLQPINRTATALEALYIEKKLGGKR